MDQYRDEIGVTAVKFNELVYIEEEDKYVAREDAPDNATAAYISGTQVREDYLAKGRELPAWFTRPETAEILKETHPPATNRGSVSGLRA